MKRAIKIILIFLAAFLLVLGIIWLIGRHTAKENGVATLSFRQFLGLGGKEIPATGNGVGTGGAGSSNFNDTGTGGGSSSGNSSNGNGSGQNGNASNGSGSANGAGIGSPQVSQFTNGGITPTNSGLGNGLGSGLSPNGIGLGSGLGLGANGLGSGSGTGSLNNSSQGGVGGNASTSSTALACGDADTNITFTPAQLAALNALQNRFYALAQTLHTDEDVATELANHDAFALKAAQATELYNYCEAKLPYISKIPNAQLQVRVPTPFWNDPKGDTASLLLYDPVTTQHLQDVHDNHPVDSKNPDTSGIRGPFGALSFSNPQQVPITGSIVKANSTTTGPFGLPLPPNPLKVPTASLPGQSTTTRPADYPLLMPVVERILRVNLW